jgi:hypothetical protein
MNRLDPGGRTVALAIHAATAIVMTWPVSRHITTSIASDWGDPALNCWVLMWTAGQTIAALSGDLGALGRYFHGNIFYPEPLTLAYSEHLTPQMLQILPVYAATGNILLSYNLLFISTFALSGFAMHLFVRDLTNRPLAALVAGMAFAYAPYRLGQLSHLQVLSSFWMPLVLLGIRRYLAERRLRPLVGAAAALVAENLSCGYYLLFFPPLAVAYGLFEMAHRHLLADRRVWIALGLAAAAVALATLPFVRPYATVRESGRLGVRSPGEIAMFSADTHAFGTLAPSSRVRLWRETFSGYPKGEGEGFVGLTIAALAGVALACGIGRRLRQPPWSSWPGWRLALVGALAASTAISLFVVVLFFVNGRFVVGAGGRTMVFHNVARPLAAALVSTAVLHALLRRFSEVPRTLASVPFFGWALVAAALLALGPRIEAGGQPLGQGPYAWLLALVPGLDGLRVPARLLMLVALCLAVLAGLGAAAFVSGRLPRLRRATVVVAVFAVLAESWAVPMPLNLPVAPAGPLSPVRRLETGSRVGPLYSMIARLPDPVVLIEFPFGEPAYEIQAMFYAGSHRRPLVNGYSGFFPESYLGRAAVLARAPTDWRRAADALTGSGATHALVHEGAFRDNRGREISLWLDSLGARLEAQDGTDRLYRLR